VYGNLWIGTFVVVGTIFWLAMTTCHAFNSKSYFSLGFSVIGWSWLVFWLGFYAETPETYENWPVPRWIYSLATGFQEIPEYNPKFGHNTYARMHSLHVSSKMAYQEGMRRIPTWKNAIRLVVCVSSLIAGVIGGLLTNTVFRSGRLPKEVIDGTKE
jgi:hypothetical protein